jgi:hypothetical protein
MEGCAPGVVRSGKKGESLQIPVLESLEPLLLPYPSGVNVVELINKIFDLPLLLFHLYFYPLLQVNQMQFS